MRLAALLPKPDTNLKKPPIPLSRRIARLIAELKGWAIDQGFSQKELAKKLGVSPQLVTEWFAKRREPTGEKVLEIQELLKTKPRGGEKASKKPEDE